MKVIEQDTEEGIVEDWGIIGYEDALQRQLQYVEALKAKRRPDTLALLEHPPVFTLGVRKDAEKNLIWDSAQRVKEGIELFKSNRGGDVTYHGPGQIVGYLICDVRGRRDLHLVLREVESMLIRTLADLGLHGTRREEKTGIWFEDRKIAAIGVAVKSWVTYHGFSLNVSPDLRHFSGIVPCGITDGSVTSLKAEMTEVPSLTAVKKRLACHFRGFRRAMEERVN